mgnify:CR=1 FL=1
MLSARVAIRPATSADLDAAWRVYRDAFGPLRAVYRPRGDVEAHERARAALGSRLVAILDGEVVGTVQFEVHARHVHVIGLAVDPRHQRRGIGSLLVEGVAALAPSLGHRVLALDTIRETGNVEVFERMGFRVTGERETPLFESDAFARLHEVLMERRLP